MPFKNFAYSTVSTAPSPATSGTSLDVATSDGTKFPATPFTATIWPRNTSPSTSNAEIVRVVAISSDTFTIIRTQESTSARSIEAGDQIMAGFTADLAQSIENSATQTAIQGAQLAAQLRAAAGYYPYSGGAITVNGATAGTSAARVDLSTGTDYVGTTEYTYPAQTAQPALATGNSTTVAAGSDGTQANSFTGSQTLSVASTAGFPTTGTIMVGDVSGGVVAILTYNGTTGGFQNCTFINSGQSTTFQIATSDTVVGTNADTAKPKWAVLETTASQTALALNLGTADYSPAIPDPTAARVPRYLLYMPPNCTIIDTLLTNNNGNAKLIDIRQTSALRPARIIFNDVSAQLGVTNPTAPTTILPATVTLPAYSMRAGDLYEIRWSGFYSNSQNNTDLLFQIKLGSNIVAQSTFTAVPLDATLNRKISIHCYMGVYSQGASSLIHSSFNMAIGPATGTVTGELPYQYRDGYTSGSATFDTGASQVLDVLADVITSSSTSAVTTRLFTVVKYPVA